MAEARSKRGVLTLVFIIQCFREPLLFSRFVLFCFVFLFLFLPFCFVSNSIPLIIFFVETLRYVVLVFFVCLLVCLFQTSDVCIHTTA